MISVTTIVQSLREQPWSRGLSLPETFWEALGEHIYTHLLTGFLEQVVRQVDEILEIPPDDTEPRILETVTRHMVNFLGAQSASVRIYDPLSRRMVSYGSYPYRDPSRETHIPLEGSIAGEVVRTMVPCLVPSIDKDPRFQNKDIIRERGVHSLLAVPFHIPRFYPLERDMVGVIQIYFREEDHVVPSLDVQMAKLMARRLSYVMARRKIYFLQKANEKKERIVQQIFRTLGTRGGIKMKEVFETILPELADIVEVQSADLFSVSRDLSHVVQEAQYPLLSEQDSRKGALFPVQGEPLWETLIGLRNDVTGGPYDIVTHAYILLLDPQKSLLLSDAYKRFAAERGIHAALFLPLGVDGHTEHIMAFEAVDQKQRYRQDEIDLLLFLGRELAKAKKMERLDDAIHDFKNPSIAIAGFARRLKRHLQKAHTLEKREEMLKYADILAEETSRLQELALSIYHVGDEETIDLTAVLNRRFEINEEAIKEQLRQSISLQRGRLEPRLWVRGYTIHVERVLDNLLNNATKAIPLKGGVLGIASYPQEDWACAEIMNTGVLPEEDRIKILAGEGEGRGLYITLRIIHLLRGRLEVLSEEGTTTFKVWLPLHENRPTKAP